MEVYPKTGAPLVLDRSLSFDFIIYAECISKLSMPSTFIKAHNHTFCYTHWFFSYVQVSAHIYQQHWGHPINHRMLEGPNCHRNDGLAKQHSVELKKQH